jgi:hypothetical protein
LLADAISDEISLLLGSDAATTLAEAETLLEPAVGLQAGLLGPGQTSMTTASSATTTTTSEHLRLP